MEALKVKNATVREREIAAAITASSAASVSGLTDKTTVTDADVSSNNSGTMPKKKPGKAKISAKAKKERSVRDYFGILLESLAQAVQLEIERIISCLPLEFRGSDPVGFKIFESEKAYHPRDDRACGTTWKLLSSVSCTLPVL